MTILSSNQNYGMVSLAEMSTQLVIKYYEEHTVYIPPDAGEKRKE